MFDRRGEDFGSWLRTEKGAGREMHDQTPGGRDVGRDESDHSWIHEEPGEWGGPQTPYEVGRPFDPRNGSGGNAMVESEKEKTGRPRDVASLTTCPASAIIRSSPESPNEIWTETASAPRETACSTVEERTLDPGLELRRVPAERCTIRPQAGAMLAEMSRTIPGFTRSPENGADRRRRTRSVGRSIPGTGPAATPWSRARRKIRPAPPSRRCRRLSTPKRDMSLRSPAPLWKV